MSPPHSLLAPCPSTPNSLHSDCFCGGVHFQKAETYPLSSNRPIPSHTAKQLRGARLPGTKGARTEWEPYPTQLKISPEGKQQQRHVNSLSLTNTVAAAAAALQLNYNARSSAKSPSNTHTSIHPPAPHQVSMHPISSSPQGSKTFFQCK